jgi:hypothetical protein
MAPVTETLDMQGRHESARDGDDKLPMSQRIGPFALITCGALLVGAIASGLWLTLLPSRTLSLLQEQSRQLGFEMTAASSGLSFEGGAGASLSNVTFTSVTGDVTGKIKEVRISAAWPWATPELTLEHPTLIYRLPVKVAPTGASKTSLSVGNGMAFKAIIISEGQVQFPGGTDKPVFLIDGINAEAKLAPEALMLTGHAGINDVRTLFKVETDSPQRLFADGAPADIAIASTNDDAPFDLQFSGRMKLDRGFQLDGRFSSAASDAQAFLSMLGLPNGLPIQGALATEGAVSLSGQELSILDLTLSQGALEGKGRIKVGFGESVHNLDGVLHLPKLTLPALSLGGAWSERAFVLPDTTHWRGLLEVNAETLMFGLTRFDAPKLSLRVDDDGQSALLRAGNESEQFEAKLSAVVQNSAPQFGFQGKFATQNVSQLVTALSGVGFVGGPATGGFDLKATGRNMAEVTASATGTLAVELKQADINGYGISKILTSSGQGWQSGAGDQTKAVDASVSLVIDEGIALFTGNSFKAGGKEYTIKGEVDFLRKALSVDVTPKGGKRIGILGPWAEPDIGPDIVGAPKPLTVDEQAATSGN